MQCNAKDQASPPMSACPTGTQPTDLLASLGSQPHETNRAGARRRLSVSPPEIASSLPFGCYWRDFINRFVLHARHVLRAVASGQEGGATSGRATIGGRGCARQRVDACRARRRSLPRRVGGGGRPEGCGLPATTPEARRLCWSFCRLCALRYSCWRGSDVLQCDCASLCCRCSRSWAPVADTGCFVDDGFVTTRVCV